MLEYSLKFTQFSKYAPLLVSDPKDEMKRFVMGVSNNLKEECYSAMLYVNKNISRLMVHAQQVEDACDNRRSRDAMRARSFDRGFSKGALEIQDKPRFKESISNNVPSKFHMARDDRVSNSKTTIGRDTS